MPHFHGLDYDSFYISFFVIYDSQPGRGCVQHNGCKDTMPCYSFNRCYPAVCDALIFISEWGDSDSSSTIQLLISVVGSNFLIRLIDNICNYLLYRFLQTKNTDLASALRIVSVVHTKINRNHSPKIRVRI